MPQATCRHAATAMGGKIFVSGGHTGANGRETSTVVVFDPRANTWTQLASMGSARGAHASAAIGGKLYAFGGTNSARAGHLDSVEAYDPISNTWEEVSDLTDPRVDMQAVAL